MKCKLSNLACELCRKRGPCEPLVAYERLIDDNARLNNQLQRTDNEVKRLSRELDDMRKPKVADLKPEPEVPACQPTQECDVAGCEASSACAPEPPKTA